MFHSQNEYVGAIKGLVTIIRDPNQTAAVFELAKAVEASGLIHRLTDRIRAASPDIDGLIRDRYLPPVADLDALSQLPEGTLGRTFADHMRRNGFDVAFYPPVAVKDDASYLAQRIRQTHDIWHVVTGFGTDPSGELGLQAFMMAQLRSPVSGMLIAGGLLRSLVLPAAERRRLLAELRRGFRTGKATRPLLAQRWEDGWHRPLSDWRVALGLSKASA